MWRGFLFGFLRLFFALRKRALKKDPEKILFMRMGGIGDVLMSTPLVRNVRLRYPGARIGYLVGSSSKIALGGNYDVDRVIGYDEGSILKKKPLEISLLIRKMRKGRYDLCFVLDKHWFFNLLAFLMGAKFRVGFDRFGEGFCNNLNAAFTGKKYELEYYLDLGRRLGVPIISRKVVIEKGDESYCSWLRKSWRKTVGIIPGAAVNPGQTLLEKRWPKEKYIELCKRLLGMGYSILILGGKADTAICSDIEAKLGGKLGRKGVFSVCNLAGLQWEKQLGVMGKCSYTVTHDSGPMHIAAAAGARVIAIFGPTDPERFAPENAKVISKKPSSVRCYDAYGHYDRKCDRWTDKVSVEDVLRRMK